MAGKGAPVRAAGSAHGADLGGSSNDSTGIVED